MDVIVAEMFSKGYIYCYDLLLQYHVTLPLPDQVFAAMSTAGQFLFDHCPEIIQQIYVSAISVPASFVPMLLAIIVLYSLFSLILWSVRAVFRLAFNFVRFGLILALVGSMLYFVQYHWGDKVLDKLEDLSMAKEAAANLTEDERVLFISFFLFFLFFLVLEFSIR
ncbi:hypothetical protein EC973_004906 [Apophysomyces ossiformis]|uniref:Uncharacterized protein n=1 Tax=Apophysomyces ossiformis TaxID=679940 RepID=A0A8H7BWS6_9FUNG|nr:hypothetical protein EC973_004906 [Apophysomyces ossiformis]